MAERDDHGDSVYAYLALASFLNQMRARQARQLVSRIRAQREAYMCVPVRACVYVCMCIWACAADSADLVVHPNPLPSYQRQ